MMPTTILIIALSFLIISIVVFVISEIIETNKKEKEHKEKISEVLPNTWWKVKKHPFEEDNNPFVEYYETVYKVLDIKENRIGNLYVKLRQGKLFESGNVYMEDKTEIIDADSFVNISDKLDKEIIYRG